MTSITVGYSYDVFISYRQKDNKGDRWVSEFVDALKDELESTFKEEISVYFDINPHDGLLETHDVDASLKERLKCLVFIPIISRTYCDPKSFAWEHEFKAFIEQASNDQFGLKVKLTSSNVASRVLPVQIHDLDPDDKKLVESELGGFLRGIEFIYKEPGVNRPLMANEDHPDNNLNKTFYRNQINKVANSIKDIITAIGQYNPQHEELSKKDFISTSVSRKKSKTTIFAGSIIALALIILGSFLIPKLFKSKEHLEKSIAVLPFKSLSDDPEKQYLADGMMDAILLNLSKIEDLRVMSRTSVEQYRETDKTSGVIGRELGVAYLLEGSFQKYGDNARLIVQLIKTGKEGHEWANEYDRIWNDIFSVQSEVAQAIARELHAVLTPEEKQTIEKLPTTNLTAYDFYQRGREELVNYWLDNDNKEALKLAENFYYKALEYDSTFAPAYSGLAMAYIYKHSWDIDSYFTENYLDSAMILANRALSYDDQLAEVYYVRGLYYLENGKSEQAINEFDKALKYNPNYWEVYGDKGSLVYSLYIDNLDFVKAIENLNKAISINHGRELPKLLFNLATVYNDAGFREKFLYYIGEYNKLIPPDTNSFWNSGVYDQLSVGNYEKAFEIGNKIYSRDSNNIYNLSNLGFYYLAFGQYKESLKYYKKYISTLKNIGQLTPHQTHRIGYVFWQNGFKKEAEYYFNEQKRICEESIKMGRSYSVNFTANYDLAGVYAFMGNRDKAYENLRVWARTPVFPLWWVGLIKEDPLFDSIRNEPEFQQIVRDVEAKYQAEHERVRKWLEEQGML
jgi:TolB-like protein/lipoprotein NlpI